MSLQLSATVLALDAAVTELAADASVTFSEDQMLGDVESMLTSRNRLEAVFIRRLRAIDAAGVTSVVTGRPSRDWLIAEMCLDAAAATRALQLARHLGEFPATETLFDAGELSLEQAAAVVRGLRTLPVELRPTVEGPLCEHAKFAPAREIGAFIDDLLERLGIDKDCDLRRERRNADRGLDVTDSFERTGVLRGTLTPEVHAKLRAALYQAAQPAGPEDDRTPRQRMHDALGEICDTYLTHVDAPASFTGAARTVVVTMPFETLESRLHSDWTATLPDGIAISPETARRLACDAEVIPVVLGTHSEVLDLGRSTRVFNAAIRRAAWLEQGGHCAFPGCRRNAVELHHITWWRDGGLSSLDNAAWLCAYHHWLIHDGHWVLRRNTDRSLTFTSPSGDERHRHPQAA